MKRVFGVTAAILLSRARGHTRDITRSGCLQKLAACVFSFLVRALFFFDRHSLRWRVPDRVGENARGDAHRHDGDLWYWSDAFLTSMPRRKGRKRAQQASKILLRHHFSFFSRFFKSFSVLSLFLSQPVLCDH